MTDQQPYAENWIMADSGPFIRDRTQHKVREVNGHWVTAECGTAFHAEVKQLFDDESKLQDRNKCNRCFGG